MAEDLLWLAVWRCCECVDLTRGQKPTPPDVCPCHPDPRNQLIGVTSFDRSLVDSFKRRDLRLGHECGTNSQDALPLDGTDG